MIASDPNDPTLSSNRGKGSTTSADQSTISVLNSRIQELVEVLVVGGLSAEETERLNDEIEALIHKRTLLLREPVWWRRVLLRVHLLKPLS